MPPLKGYLSVQAWLCHQQVWDPRLVLLNLLPPPRQEALWGLVGGVQEAGPPISGGENGSAGSFCSMSVEREGAKVFNENNNKLHWP